MPNLTVTNLNLGSVILKDGEFRDDFLTFTGAATVLAGTILARDSVSLKLVPYVKGGVANENGIPKAILTYDVVAAGAGDESIRDMVTGSVRKELLIIDADGDGTNIDNAVLDQLRDYSLVSIDVQELNILDNQ
jgi:hypothetical protein